MYLPASIKEIIIPILIERRQSNSITNILKQISNPPKITIKDCLISNKESIDIDMLVYWKEIEEFIDNELIVFLLKRKQMFKIIDEKY